MSKLTDALGMVAAVAIPPRDQRDPRVPAPPLQIPVDFNEVDRFLRFGSRKLRDRANRRKRAARIRRGHR